MAIVESSLDEIRIGPIYDIMNFEASLNTCNSAEAVITHLKKFEIQGYWADIAFILGAKRMREVGDKRQAKQFLKNNLH